MDMARLLPGTRALCYRITVIIDALMVSTDGRKAVTAELERLLEEGYDSGYASSGVLSLPLGYESAVYRWLARPESDPDERRELLRQFTRVLSDYAGLPASQRRLVWEELIRLYPAPADDAAVPNQGRPSRRSSVLPM